jgi:hypothetical protein
MNKRIQEIAEQCHHRYSEHNIDLEKFAELIVRECAGIYDKIDNGNLHMGTDNYLEALQKHFGVEE